VPEAKAKPKSFAEKAWQITFAPRDLFIIYSIKFAESTAYYASIFTLPPFLTSDFGLTDVEAGYIYALYGLLSSVYGMFAGPIIDAQKLRTSLLCGTLPCFIARFGTAMTEDPNKIWWLSVTALPLGAAFGLPVFALGVRRFTHPENRSFAFTIFYAVLSISCMAGGLVISAVRAIFHDGIVVFGAYYSWMRVNMLVCSMFTLYTFAASFFIRNARITPDVPLEQATLEPRAEKFAGFRETIRVVFGSLAFWKLLGLSVLVALGTRATFRHLDATFPKYFLRMYGDDAPFELFIAFEPVITIMLSFPVTYLLLRRRTSTFATIVGGTFLQSFCPLALLITSYPTTLAFIVLMAFGEAIWSPRLYEYSTMVAPEGFEGTYVAVTFIPQYLSAAIVGLESGFLLQEFLPMYENEDHPRNPQMLWGSIAFMSFLTPAALVVFRRCLFDEEPASKQLAEASKDVAARHAPGRTRSAKRARKLGKYAVMDEDAENDEEQADEEQAVGVKGVSTVSSLTTSAGSDGPREEDESPLKAEADADAESAAETEEEEAADAQQEGSPFT
jgi:MFS family permease